MNMRHAPLAIDRVVKLNIHGSDQRVRTCASRSGLPPLLVVQAGPGLPLLHEVPRFQRLLHLEQDFLVSYWEQRGCGPASRRDANSVSLQQQVDDFSAVLQWLHQETRQRVVVLGISIGAAIVLKALERGSEDARAVVAVSADTQTAGSDAAVEAFLQEHARAGNRRLRARIRKLGKPPYLDPASLQRRARLLIDLGTIEHGRTFIQLIRKTLVSMISAYGLTGTVLAMRNMNLVQRRLLPEVALLDLLAHPPRVAVPVHFAFGAQDALTPAAFVTQLPAAVAAPGSTTTLVQDAGHMLHFDHPEVVRSLVLNALHDRAAIPAGASA